MQVSNTGGINQNYTIQPYINNALHDLVIKKNNDDNRREVLQSHPETCGLVIQDGKAIFNEDAFQEDLGAFSTLYTLSTVCTPDHQNKELINFILSTKDNPEFNSEIDCLMKKGEWKLVREILSSLSPEKLDSLKELSPSVQHSHLEKNTPDQIISMINAFPKTNWAKNLWAKAPFGHAQSYLDQNPHEELIVYSYIKGMETVDGKDYLSGLFQPIYDVFNRSLFANLTKEIKENIFKDVVVSTYPTLANAPEVSHLFDTFCKYSWVNTKVARLAFREYRQNNGLCEKKFTPKQTKDITEMFLECLSKKTVNFDAPTRKKFIDMVGKDQEVDKPRLKKGMIEKEISLL